MGWQGTQITSRRAFRLGPPPATAQERRWQAHRLLSRGRATLGAYAVAWYGGDVEQARAEIYPPQEVADAPAH